MNLKITVVGKEEVIGTVQRLNAFSRREIKNAISEACLNVQREARRRVPVDTGRLRSSINVRFVGDMAGEVGTTVEYAMAVEFGSGLHGEKRREYIIRPKRAKALAFKPGAFGGGFGGKTIVFARQVRHPGVRPRPFLIPAWELEKDKVVPRLKKALERAAGRVA